jgi:3-oxoacyl-[acyl-carrier protein] reductase
MKTVLVSGGTRGIGRAIVTAFAENGYRVFFLYNKSDVFARELEEKLGAVGIKCDVSDAEQVKNAVMSVGDVDVLVNNAGISHVGLFTDVSDSEWRRVIDVNLSSAFYLSRAVAPSMINKKCGRIINIGSVWGRCGASCEVAYSASKSALRGFTTALAKELGPSGITVNCVEPGVIATDMNACFDDATIDALCEETPLCRIGMPNDVAELVIFLASEKASFITAQCIGVDGGFGV